MFVSKTGLQIALLTETDPGTKCLLKNKRSSWKLEKVQNVYPRTNALAYFAAVSNDKT